MWQELINCLFPKYCLNCKSVIPHFQLYICETCKCSMPFTGMDFGKNNLIYTKLNGIENGSSLLFFEENNITQNMIHFLKYKNLPEMGAWLADIWIDMNINNPNLNEITGVVPVPIHSKRLKKRGYNQITLCAKRIAERLNCFFYDSLLIRNQHMDSQINSGKEDRLSRLEGAFNRSSTETGHILLVDDVFTTGATLISCIKELSKEKETKVSVFTLAFVP